MWRRLANEAEYAGAAEQLDPVPVIKMAKLYPVVDDGLFAIHNISMTGVYGRSAIPLPRGAAVHLSLDGQRYLEAIVRDVAGGDCRLEFAEPLFDARVTGGGFDRGDGTRHVDRARRLTIDLDARVLRCGMPHGVTIRATAIGAVLLKFPGEVPPLATALVKPAHAPGVVGTIRLRGEGNCAILCFDRPFDILDLHRGDRVVTSR